MRKIRIRILLMMYRRKEILKAVALAIYIKRHTTSSTVANWSISKLARLAGINPATVKKRLAILRELGLVEEQGKRLVFTRLRSSCDRNNLDISNIQDGKVKDIEKSLAALLIVIIQRQKEYANLQLQRANNGVSLKDIKKARRERKLYGWRPSFVDHGLSYQGIARRLGVCVKTAFDIVKFGVECGFFQKLTHFFRLFVPAAAKMKEVPQGYTFISRNTGGIYKVFANTYVLCPTYQLR